MIQRYVLMFVKANCVMELSPLSEQASTLFKHDEYNILECIY